MCSDWNRDQVYELIECYKERPELWNPQHKHYNVRPQRQSAWHEIAYKMESDVDTVKSKMASLLSSFRREKSKLKGEKPYNTTWFAYKCFTFLLEKEKAISEGLHCEEEIVTVEGDVSNFKQLFEDCDYQSENPLEIKTEVTSVSRSDDFSSTYIPSSSRKRARRDYQEELPDTREKDKKALIKEECSTFAEHLAVKLKKFHDRLRVEVMHRINGIIFEAEMEKYSDDVS